MGKILSVGSKDLFAALLWLLVRCLSLKLEITRLFGPLLFWLSSLKIKLPFRHMFDGKVVRLPDKSHVLCKVVEFLFFFVVVWCYVVCCYCYIVICRCVFDITTNWDFKGRDYMNLTSINHANENLFHSQRRFVFF